MILRIVRFFHKPFRFKGGSKREIIDDGEKVLNVKVGLGFCDYHDAI